MNELDLLLEELYWKTDDNVGLCLEDYSKLNNTLKSITKDEIRQLNKDMEKILLQKNYIKNIILILIED